MRCAITIIYNSIEDLTYKGFSDFMIANFDHWIIVEGSSKNGGSTAWCHSIKTNHTSTDGTAEYLKTISAPNVKVHFHPTHYKSKDEQFNIGIEILRTLVDSCYLWQVDSDEHWSAGDLSQAEKMLEDSPSNVAEFQFNHFVQQDVIAVGDWGSGSVNRLWKWNGERFDRHEPAIMNEQTAPVLLPQKFNHYSYIHESKVKFKSQYYKGHEQVYRNWKRLPNQTYPCHISKLFGNAPMGKSNSQLIKIKDHV